MAASMYQTVLEPPYSRLKVTIDNAFKERLLQVTSCLTNLQKCETLHKILSAEGRLLHIAIYKRSAQLRIEKTIQLSKRVKACLQRLNIATRLFSLVNDMSLDIKRSLTENESEVFVPCQQVWTYVLHLTSNLFDLLSRTIEYSVLAFEHMSCQFTNGMLIPSMVLFMGITARIWQMCRSIQRRLASFYETIYAAHLDIKPSQSIWVYPSIPRELSVPSNEKECEMEKWCSTIASKSGPTLDLASDDQSIPVAKKEINESPRPLPSIPSGLCIDNDGEEDDEDLGVIVNVSATKRKGRGSDNRIFSPKKRKLPPEIGFPQERAINFVDKKNVATVVGPENLTLQKKKNKKMDERIRKDDLPNSEAWSETFDHRDSLSQDEIRLKKKKKKKKSVEVILNNNPDENVVECKEIGKEKGNDNKIIHLPKLKKTKKKQKQDSESALINKKKKENDGGEDFQTEKKRKKKKRKNV